jgi:hypothetical protein
MARLGRSFPAVNKYGKRNRFTLFDTTTQTITGGSNLIRTNLQKTQILTDDFTGTTIDTGKWFYGPTGSGSTGTTTQNGVVTLSMPSGSTVGQGAWLSMEFYHDITSSYAYAKIDPGTQSSEVAFFFKVYDPQGNQLGFYIYNTALVAFRFKPGGAVTLISSAIYNPTTHAYLRVRESAGTMYFDYSSDGITWTNLTTYLVNNVSFNFGATQVGLYFQQAVQTTLTTTRAATVDFFNILGTYTQTELRLPAKRKLVWRAFKRASPLQSLASHACRWPLRRPKAVSQGSPQALYARKRVLPA